MKLSALLQQTAVRYEAAVQSVLADWIPECGCRRPGEQPHCSACPCLAVFEQRVREEIHRSIVSEDAASSGSPSIYDSDSTQQRTYLSQSQI